MDSKDGVEEGKLEDNDLEKMKVDDGTLNKDLLFMH